MKVESVASPLRLLWKVQAQQIFFRGHSSSSELLSHSISGIKCHEPTVAGPAESGLVVGSAARRCADNRTLPSNPEFGLARLDSTRQRGRLCGLKALERQSVNTAYTILYLSVTPEAVNS